MSDDDLRRFVRIAIESRPIDMRRIEEILKYLLQVLFRQSGL